MATHPPTPPLPHALAATAGPIVEGAPGLEWRLLQLLRDSQTAQSALAHFAQAIGTALGVEQCIVSMGAATGQVRGVSWSVTSLGASSIPPDLLPCLQALAGVDAALALADVWDAEITQPPIDASSRVVARLRQSPFRAVLANQTYFHGQWNGTLLLLSTQPRCWQESEIRLLQTLATHVAVTISHAQLEQQIEKQIQCQSLIDQLTTAIRHNAELNEIYRQAVLGVVNVLQVDQGMLLLFKYVDPLRRVADAIPKTQATVAAYAAAEPRDPAATLTIESTAQSSPNLLSSFWASDCRLCQQMLIGQSELVISAVHASRNAGHSTSSYAAFEQATAAGETAALLNLERFPAMLMVPLENQGTVLGCLVMQQSQHHWLPEEVVFVKLVAAQLSTAIIQTRTLQQVQAVVQERTAQLQRSLEVQAKLYEKTRQQVEQLRRLNTEREEFLSTVSHELLTPLTSMALAIRMLRQADLSAERRRRYLDILEQQCVQETNLINDLLALRKLESNPTPLQVQKLDLCNLIRELTQSLASGWTEADLSLVLDLPADALMLYTEADSLNRILKELLTNARKYSAASSTVQLKVDQHSQDSIYPIEITVRNVGAGIPPEELPFIFDKFRRCQGVTQQAIQGTGLGLALVKGLVQHLGGNIEATSAPLELPSDPRVWETCFTLRLPQRPEGVKPAIG